MIVTKKRAKIWRGDTPPKRQGARGVSPQPLPGEARFALLGASCRTLRRITKWNSRRTLHSVLPAMFFLGLVSMAVVYLFMDACEKI